MNEQEIITELKKGSPFDGLREVKVIEVSLEPIISEYNYMKLIRNDVILRIDFSGMPFTILGEIKSQLSPKLLLQISPGLFRFKKSNLKEIPVLITSYITKNLQDYCLKNNINFIDLSGNVSINVPGKVLIQRLGQPNKKPIKQILRNPFWGASSRVLRVLLQYPERIWTISEIDEEIKMESEKQKIDFKLSLASISKTVKSLDEELLIRRDGKKIIVPDPKQLIFRWAEKYREMDSRTISEGMMDIRNPFSSETPTSVKKLLNIVENIKSYTVTGTSAATLAAPFINIDRIEIKVLQTEPGLFGPLPLLEEQSIGPEFDMRVVKDEGMIMYSKEIEGIRIASDIQIYLDCYSKGGRDLKQAEYFLEKVIEKRWAGND